MTVAGSRSREGIGPALIAALVLHVGLFLILTLTQRSSLLPAGNPVPINIVSSEPKTDSRRAEQAPQAQDAAMDTPTPDAAPPAPPPAPPPPAPPKQAPLPKTMAKPTPAPTPKPTPSPVKSQAKAKPTQAKTAPAQPRDSNFLESLQASIASAERSAPARPAFARRGPTRAETAPVARVDAGQGVSQSDLQGLQQLLERLWNPNCSVEGGDAVLFPVKFQVGDDGQIVGRIVPHGASDPVTEAAARRAIDAVHRAAPYADAYRGKSFTVNFDAKKACAAR